MAVGQSSIGEADRKWYTSGRVGSRVTVNIFTWKSRSSKVCDASTVMERFEIMWRRRRGGREEEEEKE